MKKHFFWALICCLLFIGCKNNEDEDPFNIVGDWYICQHWGEQEKQEIEVYELENGKVKEIEHPEKTEIKNWDDNYAYGKNIISFKQDNSISFNCPDFYLIKDQSYILDDKNKKLICINGNNKTIYDILNVSDNIILYREYNETYESGSMDYENLNNGERGIMYTKIIYNTIIHLKLVRIN